MEKRRPQLIELFEAHMHGRAPVAKAASFDKAAPVFDGRAVRRQVEIRFGAEGPKADLLLYLPAGAKRAPVLLQIGFGANSTSVGDPGIRPGEVWSQ